MDLQQLGAIAAIATVIVSIVGWVAIPYVKNLLDEGKAQKQTVVDILSACRKRAIYTPMLKEQNTAEMLASTSRCRSTLQEKITYIGSSHQQQIVAKIIDELDYIEGYRKNVAHEAYEHSEYSEQELSEFQNLLERHRINAQEHSEYSEQELSELRNLTVDLDTDTFDEIDQAKSRILKLLQDLKHSAGVTYDMPSELVRNHHRIESREDADEAPNGTVG